MLKQEGSQLEAASVSISHNIPYYPVIIFLALAFSIGSAGYFYYTGQKADILREKQDELSAIADLKVGQIKQWREELTADANAIFKNPFIYPDLREFFERPQHSGMKKKIITWLETLNEEKKYKEVFLFDARGDLRLEVPGDGNKVGPHMLALCEEALKSHKIIFSDLHREEDGKQIHLSLVVPILTTGVGGIRSAGVLVLVRDPYMLLYPLIRSWPTPSHTAETLLVRRDGDEVLFLNELRHRKDSALNLRISIARGTLPAAMALLGKEGIVEGLDYRDVPVIAAIKKVPDSPWFIVSKVDKEEIYGPIRRRAWFISIIVAIAIVSAALSVGLWWRHQRVIYYRRQYDTEETLRVLSLRNEAILAAVPDIIMEVDNNRVYTWANAAGKEFFGPEVIGKEAAYFFEGQQETYDAVQPLFNGNEDLLYVESWQRRKDGEKRLLAWWCRTLKDEQGKVKGALSSAQDITEQRRATMALRDREELLNLAGKMARMGGWEFDAVTLKGTWTDEVARIHEMAPDGETNVELGVSVYHGVSRSRIETAIKEVIDLGKPYDLELEMTTAGGVHKWVRTIGHPVKEGDRVIKVHGMIQDITERKKTEEEIRRLNEELEERVRQRTAQLEAANMELEGFSYSVSHDLRAPLRHITGFAELLIKKAPVNLDEKSRHYLDVISESARQMGKLVDDLLSFSRMGRAEMLQARVNFDKLVAEARETLKTEIAGRDIAWEVRPLPECYGDPVMMKMVFVNLISNAIKFTRNKSGARIEIGHMSERPGEEIFYVKDNGAGFDMKYVEKLFGLFQRLHRSEEFEGTGLGLANVRRIVHRHGGRTWAEGEVNEGAVVYFSLPGIKER